MTDAILRPIETHYRGYRFRSRLESRWAVFFDAAEIEWQYEPEGFSLNGRSYLPDFWLPQMAAFVEIKPTEATGKQAIPLLKELVAKTGKTGLLLIGSPNLHHEPHKIIIIEGESPSNWWQWADWQQCMVCNRILIGSCNCTSAIKVLSRTEQRFRHIDHALLEAQQARFEHGEDGRPQPYRRDDSTLPLVEVYVAGAVLEEEQADGDDNYSKMLRWRCDIFGETDVRKFNVAGYLRDGRFQYAGPTILGNHGGMYSKTSPRTAFAR
jgi:hypothetical protein